MTERVAVAEAAALEEGVPVKVEAFGREIALVRHQGVVRALDDVCPHRGGPMHQGEVVDGCLECPLHGWAFSLETGRMDGGSGVALEVFSVREEDGRVYLEAPS
jgi:nitrite reductase (NADH) small subunit